MSEPRVTVSGLASRLGRTPELGDTGVLVITWECTAEGKRRNSKAGTVVTRHLAVTDVLELRDELPEDLVTELKRQRREAEESDTGAPVIEGLEGWLDGSGVLVTDADRATDGEEADLINADPEEEPDAIEDDDGFVDIVANADAEPWEGYAACTVDDIRTYLEDYARADAALAGDRETFRRMLGHIRAYEVAHKARKTILNLVDTRLTELPPPPAIAPDGTDPDFEAEPDLD